jgi:hypothetical protein
MSVLTQQQGVALIDELESATKLIDLGVGELHKIDGANNYYHLPMQLLSQGLERFLKLTYAMATLGSAGGPSHAQPDATRIQPWSSGAHR